MVRDYIYDLLDILEQKINENMVPISYYVESCLIFSYYHKFHIQNHIVEKLISSQKNQGDIVYNGKKYLPIYLLYALSSFSNTSHKNSIKKYKKQIRKSLQYLESHLDSTYLLFKNHFQEFDLEDHSHFLSICSSLSDLLNEVGMHKEADSLFMLKGKVELGFKRYFIQDSNLVSYFNPNTLEFKFANTMELLECIGILKEEVPNELSYNLLLENYSPNSLMEELLVVYCRNVVLRKKTKLHSISLYFLKKGVGKLIDKEQWIIYENAYTSLFFENPLPVSTKKSQYLGIKESISVSQLLYTLELLK